MASTREIRRRIRSIKSTAQITKAMQLVAAAKMRKAQEAALNGKSYARTLLQVLESMASTIDPTKHPLLSLHDEGETAVVVFSSNRGLAGALNTNLFKEIEQTKLTAHYVTVGKKGRDYVVKTRKNLTADYLLPDAPDFGLAKTLAKMVIEDFSAHKINKAILVYPDFINTLRQQPMTFPLLPITKAAFASIIQGLESKKEQDQDQAIEAKDFLFEPTIDELLDEILRHFVEMRIYQAMLEASASEHSARMIAMKNATDNALELVDDLTLSYNQLRQSAITKELLEITTAAAALQ